MDEGRGMRNGELVMLKRRQLLRRGKAEPSTSVGPQSGANKNERDLNPSQRVLLSLCHFGFSVSGGMTK
ncbi:hypothetical protein sync_0703 [Synechococcus sp. CC9311]|nr:hypothetical protein sync_0703 [Synechococcus sp. CC9311]